MLSCGKINIKRYCCLEEKINSKAHVVLGTKKQFNVTHNMKHNKQNLKNV
jgi:hypothetical protein